MLVKRDLLAKKNPAVCGRGMLARQKKPSEMDGFFVLVRRSAVVRLAVLFHKLASQGLVLAVQNCGRLFVVLALFPFADDAFFFYHSLKAFDRFFKILRIFN